MQLPAELREAIAQKLEGVSRHALAERARRISEHYRGGGASVAVVRDEMDALAYAVSRMPATYAAARNVLERLKERCPEFAPRDALDLGAGPGTASWAAQDAWPEIERIAQIDANHVLLQVGKVLAQSSSCKARREAEQTRQGLSDAMRSDLSAELVILSYTLAEVAAREIEAVVCGAWRACKGALVIVEPGTPAGYERILRARDLLKAEGARIAAPCPHELACPLTPPDWCHFAQRIARSRDHMLLKSAELPYEDERFSYLVAVREELFHPAEGSRVLARPDVNRAGITMQLCRIDGRCEVAEIGKRDREAYRIAKKKDWGDEL